jgi:hypothetical protein
MRTIVFPPAPQFDVHAARHVGHSQHDGEWRPLCRPVPARSQVQITLQLNRRMVELVKIFAGCPRSFIQSLVFKLVPSICVMGDYIVKDGEYGDCMYFIRRGMGPSPRS